jgi:hypothetical protein
MFVYLLLDTSAAPDERVNSELFHHRPDISQIGS